MAFRLVKIIRASKDEYRDHCIGLGTMKEENSIKSTQSDFSEAMLVYPDAVATVLIKKLIEEAAHTFGELCAELTDVKVTPVLITNMPTCNIRKAMKKLCNRGDLFTLDMYAIEVSSKQGDFKLEKKKNCVVEINTPQGGIMYHFVPTPTLQKDGLIR